MAGRYHSKGEAALHTSKAGDTSQPHDKAGGLRSKKMGVISSLATALMRLISGVIL